MEIMTSNLNTILILGGLLFILIAIVGGGFSIQEITIPKVPKWMRVISFFVGLALAYISIFPLQPPTPETGSISVSSSPSGASVYLDGGYKGTTPMTIKEVRAGSYTITLKLTGYQDWSQTVSVVAGETAYVSPSLTFIPTTGSISVYSTPSGASVYLDGNYKGTTPLTITKVEEGSYTITLKLTGYQDWSQTINVVAGETAYVSSSLTFIPTTGSISVSSSPSGASVYLDGGYKGTTPMTIKEVRAGSYTITLKLTGYQDWSQTVSVVAGETAYVSPILTVQGISTPTQLSPADGSVFSNYPRTTTLKWSAVPGAVSYTVEIDCYNCCQNNQWCTDVGKTWNVVPNLATTSYTFDFVGAQPGRWRVWAVDANGQVSPKSSWWGFTYTV